MLDEDEKATKESNKIWESIPGARQLFEIYGYWPTLHDASLVDFSTDWGSRAISLTVEYHDITEFEPPDLGPNERGTATTICIRWGNVKEARFRYWSNEITGFLLRANENCIESIFEEYYYGFSGHILSESVEITSVRISNDDNLPEPDYLNLTRFLISG